jgi:hypothetical protein
MSLSEKANIYYEICSEILRKCKQNKDFGLKIKDCLYLKNLEEKGFLKAIIKYLDENCIDKERVRKVSDFFGQEEFRRNLLNSKVERDTSIRTCG